MGFRREVTGVSGGVSEGFPWVSRGFRDSSGLNRMTEILGFATPLSKGLGFPNATENPFYNIKRLVAQNMKAAGGMSELAGKVARASGGVFLEF